MPDVKKVDQRQAAVEPLSDIMGQQLVKSPELAAKQARFLALLKANAKPPGDAAQEPGAAAEE